VFGVIQLCCVCVCCMCPKVFYECVCVYVSLISLSPTVSGWIVKRSNPFYAFTIVTFSSLVFAGECKRVSVCGVRECVCVYSVCVFFFFFVFVFRYVRLFVYVGVGVCKCDAASTKSLPREQHTCTHASTHKHTHTQSHTSANTHTLAHPNTHYRAQTRKHTNVHEYTNTPN